MNYYSLKGLLVLFSLVSVAITIIVIGFGSIPNLTQIILLTYMIVVTFFTYYLTLFTSTKMARDIVFSKEEIHPLK